MKTKRALMWLTMLSLALVLCAFCACSGDDDDDDNDSSPDEQNDAFQVGFARVDISPDHSVIMGGYGTAVLSDIFCRWSSEIHDPLYATAVAFEHPEDGPVILIHLDVVGAIITDIEVIREGVAQELSISVDRIVVAASHSHGSPDTMGIWGVWIPPKTGRDDAFIQGMIAGAIEAGILAYQARVPATLTVATGIEDQMHYNPQSTVDRNAITDDTMNFLAAYDLEGRLIGTLMSWGCHPMVMGPQNTMITADYPGAYYRIMDGELGGINMYVNTSLGATVHPQNPYQPFDIGGNRWGTWEDVDNFGRVLADDAKALLTIAQPLASYDLHVLSKTVQGQLKNPLFAMAGDLIPRDIPPMNGWGESVVTAFSIGEVRFGTVPGELVPDIGLELREIMGGDHQFLITLGMDWFGYIMTEKQYRNLLYFYFSILCVGPDIGNVVVDEYHGIFDFWPPE